MVCVETLYMQLLPETLKSKLIFTLPILLNSIAAYGSGGRGDVEANHRPVQRTGGKGIHDVASGKVDTMDR